MAKHDVSHYKKLLVIDTTARDQTSIGLIVDGTLSVITDNVRAQELQKMIAELLTQLKLKYSDLNAVAVLTGPGSFTGSRIGATAANTIRWLTGSPIIDIPGNNFKQALQSLKKNQQFDVTTRALPRY